MGGGDGLGGLSAAILMLSLLMIGGVGWLFWLVASRATAAPRASAGSSTSSRPRASRRRVTILFVTLLGLALGYLLMIGTFREDLVDPSPQIRLVTPPSYRDGRIFILEDPIRGRDIDWQGGNEPFSTRFAVIEVPASGVVRLRAMRAEVPVSPGVYRADINIIWGEDRNGGVNGGGDGPPGTGARAYLIVERSDALAGGTLPALPADPAALGEYILAREGGR